MLGFIMVVFTLAGFIKGVIGLGLPAVSMGLLTVFLSPYQAASLLIVPSMLTNFWQLFAEGEVLALLKRFWSLVVGIIVGSIWSIFPTLSDQTFPSEALLGAMLALYGLYGLMGKKLADLSAYERYLSPIVGYLGGALTVATGVIVIPVVPYVQSLQLKRDQLVQTLGLAFTVSTCCLAVFLYQNPVEQALPTHMILMLGLVPALLGMWLGTKIRYRISEERFRRIFFIGVFTLGSYMLLHRIWLF
ncbi:sulfite exporter TauE/SafE family protein [Acinetobacter rudis]|uniref:Probable membrane transporter protein n=1 Tax=Acinetobacter rudis TaxID=632955 RepID=A0AAW8JCY2_9GAMM|nr:sulfite exporter TauE/SafE family protein [Acinetobacter rudis]MDQ8936945.1 sulfite exporter TauE/SafE family protein [Acinetobacter rudis]MDQ8954432.1 sulfite exporter TauE/SafE family protein [Acinetobacter rudis]MDQ9019165.1 sulfite exporter TauE/SafE family protein [Acinetobacter rudis]